MRRKERHHLEIVFRHVDTVNMAALYIEALANDYDDDFANEILWELARRENCFEYLTALSKELYKQGLMEAWLPVQSTVLVKFLERGDLDDVVNGLVERNNLENAIKNIAANCEWLPAEEITDELINVIAKNLTTPL